MGKISTKHNRIDFFQSLTKRSKLKRMFNQFELQTMILPGIILLIIFKYLPMYGVIIAFKDYNIAEGFSGSEWVGFDHFIEFITDRNFYRVLRNTLGINLIGLILGFPAPIIFALLLNEITNKRFKKLTQTVSYLPYFVSWVIFGGLIVRLLSLDNGAVNDLLINLQVIKEPIAFMAEPNYFWWIAVISGIAKGMGWGSIIYLAAMSNTNMNLYEAAIIDGARRFQRMWHVTIPSITGTIVIFLIFNISGILENGFDQIWMLQNNLNVDMSEVIDTYVYKVGLAALRFSYATAVGFMRSVIAVILLMAANYFSKRVTEHGLF